MEAVLFFIAAIGALGGAIGVVAMRNPFYSVLALIAHLFSLAVLFLMLTSAFVAAAQVVVHADAVPDGAPEQLVEGDPEVLSLDVPQGLVDTGER